jgi:hypothetical protein
MGEGKSRARRKSSTRDAGSHRQVNVRVEPALYRALEAVARQERRSVPQAARRLMEEGLHRHTGGDVADDDTAAEHVAGLAVAGGAFNWLADEPDLYDDTSGEPV